MGEEPRQRVPQLRERQSHPGVDLFGEKPEQRQREHAADQRPAGLARHARRERAPGRGDDVQRLRGELDERGGDLNVDGGPVRGVGGNPAKEKGRDEQGRDEASRGEGERGRRGELEGARGGGFPFVAVFLLRRLCLLLLSELVPGDASAPDPFAGQEEDGGVYEVELDGGDLFTKGG